ncbi:putative adenosine monophosphate-protein transferase Fic [Rugamonas rubra]|uniref:putative adenosine monophosphate-protein transferase Fic n=1 Tax=Rugamonas rubra TaxID=758825 RepID=UPI000B812797|nr:putative adenosine monophosphate-protein transferase Fic [Rugamonas rubra]
MCINLWVYCYPDSEVLKNILNITDQSTLNDAEVAFSQHRLATFEYPALSKFSLNTWKNIHFYLFQDVYDWAGELRTVKIRKGSSVFAMPEQLDQYGGSLFSRLEKESFLCGLEQSEFVKRLAFHFGELNVLHPFREGNGRSQRLLFELIALNAGYVLDWLSVNKDIWIRANISAYNGDYAPLEQLFDGVVKKISMGY